MPTWIFGQHRHYTENPRDAGDFSASIADAAALSCGCKVSHTSHGGRPRTWWWTPEVREGVELKKEFYQAILAHRTPQIVNRYQRPSSLQLGLSGKQKPTSGRSSGKPWRKTQSALKRFWQTVQCLRRGKQCSANSLCSAERDPTGDIDGQ